MSEHTTKFELIWKVSFLIQVGTLPVSATPRGLADLLQAREKRRCSLKPVTSQRKSTCFSWPQEFNK